MNLFHITKIQKFHQRTREYNDVVIRLTSIRLYTTPKNNACTSLYDIYAKSHSHAYGVNMRRRMGGLAPTIDEADGRIAKQSHGVKMRRRMGGLAPTIDEADGRIAKQSHGVKMRRRMGGLAPTIDEADGRIAKQSHGPLRITASLAQTCPAFIFVIEEPQR